MNDEDVLGAFLLVNNPIVLSEEETKDVQKAIKKLQQENRKQKEIIDETINAIDLVIELIKQQPTKDDRWILDRLNGFKIILECKEVSE